MLCVHCEQATESVEHCDHCGEEPRVGGRYEISEVLGRGATATTYRARDTETGTEVALKELLVRNADSLKTLEMFEREAKTLAQLEHPGVPRYLGDFTEALGPNVGMYLVQEFVDGEPLSDRLGNERLSTRLVLRAVRGVAEVLQYLHRLSPPVVHRDIKPHNIIRRASGTISLIDFGSVQDAVGSSEDGVPTMAGTVGYMASEQLLGRAEPASDIYALGATAAALISGMPAADALADPTSWAEGNPAELSQLITAMLASRPSNRPTASILLQRIDEAIDAFDQTAIATTRRDELAARFEETPRSFPADFDHPTEGLSVQIGVVGFVGLLLGGPLALAGGWAIAAGVFLVVAVAVIAMAWVHTMGHRKVKLFQTGAVAIGTVAGTVEAGRLEVHYTYPAGGAYHRGKFAVQSQGGPMKLIQALNGWPDSPETLHSYKDRLAEGANIVVIYDPDRPSHHRPLPAFLSDVRLT